MAGIILSGVTVVSGVLYQLPALGIFVLALNTTAAGMFVVFQAYRFRDTYLAKNGPRFITQKLPVSSIEKQLIIQIKNIGATDTVTAVVQFFDDAQKDWKLCQALWIESGTSDQIVRKNGYARLLLADVIWEAAEDCEEENPSFIPYLRLRTSDQCTDSWYWRWPVPFHPKQAKPIKACIVLTPHEFPDAVTRFELLVTPTPFGAVAASLAS